MSSALLSHRSKTTRLGRRRRQRLAAAGILFITFAGGQYLWAACAWEQLDLMLYPSAQQQQQHQLAVPNAMTKTIPIVIHAPYDGPLARVFETYPRELPCFSDPQHDYRWRPVADRGMYYAKLSKCSSSTLSGIAIQIARNTAARRNMSAACLVRCDHGAYSGVPNRIKAQSTLWTFLREPAARQVSDHFHFHVSREGVDPNDAQAAKAAALEGLQIHNYMTGGATKRLPNNTSANGVAFIMEAFDFIGLVERFHESLIILKLIYNLELRDILYTSAKRSGGYDDGEKRNTCYFIQPSVVSTELQHWFKVDEDWLRHSETDNLLFRVVNASLELTVHAFGREQIARQVSVLQSALEYADQVCGPTAVFPCSSTGVKRLSNEATCIDHDWACAYKCIETLDLSMFE